MRYDFASKKSYLNFLSKLTEGPVGDQSIIYYDDKNEKVIKIFALTDYSNIREKEAKLRELVKYKSRFPNAALPEEIIRCNGRCCGYTMPMLKNCVSLKDFQIKARKHAMDERKILNIACKLAELVKDLHSEGIIIGDFHADQFMTRDGDVFVCDTDTWGIEGRYEADKTGRVEYIDPQVRDFSANGVVIDQYTQQSDCFSLAVVVFEMLVGFNPFDGVYPLARDYDQPLKALNRISIIGNHNLKKLDSFKIEHVAWMSEGLQNDFLKIFEGGKRFNILDSLELTRKSLKKCKKGHYYNSSRYSKCPVCKSSSENALETFRTYSVTSISYGRYAIFPDNEVRKVIDDSTYFDFNEKAIHINSDGSTIEKEVDSRVKEMYFLGNGITISVRAISRIKQFFYTLFGKFNSLYGNCSFGEKLKKCRDSNNPACNLEICNKAGEKLYSAIILKQSSRLKISGDYLFYVNGKNELIKVYMTVDNCAVTVANAEDNPFIYEINRNGDYCICAINGAGHLDIKVNGQQKKQLMEQFPRAIKYDSISKNWCVINKRRNSNGYDCYIVRRKGRVLKQFRAFSFGGLNLKNSIYFNWMLVIPADKRVLFLKSGKTVEESTVSQINIGVVNKDSKIFIREDMKNACTYLFIQNSTQVYRMRLS